VKLDGPKVKWDDLMAIDSIGHLDTTIAVELLNTYYEEYR
jgi:hypothetical protein